MLSAQRIRSRTARLLTVLACAACRHTASPNAAGTPAHRDANPSPTVSASAAPPPSAANARAQPPAPNDGALAPLAEFPALAETARRELARPRYGVASSNAKAVILLRTLGSAIVPYTNTYDGADESGEKGLSFLLLGSAPGAALDVESDSCGFIAERSKGEHVWDLRGNGSHWVVFSEMNGGAHCSQGQDEAYEFVNGRWIRPDVVPQRPTGLGDVNGDGAPDYPVNIVFVDLGACAWVNCSAYGWVVAVEGYERWDGPRLSHSPTPFRSVYAGRYAGLLQHSKLPDDSGEDNPPTCAIWSARSAAEAYTYGVLGGRPEREALALARRFMKGKSVADCPTPNGTPVLPWPQALEQLRASVKALASLK